MNKVLTNIKKNRYLLIMLIIILSSLMINCKSNVPVITKTYTDFPTEFKGIIKNKKIYVTSIGQSIEANYFYENIKTLDDFDITYQPNLEKNQIDQDTIVFVIVGCSVKGLTEANTSIQKETERAQAIIDGAKAGLYTLISWHTGGMSRRGYTSDTLIALMFENSHLDLYIKAGNTDNFLTNTADSKQIPIYEIEYFNNIKDTIYLLLGKEIIT